MSRVIDFEFDKLRSLLAEKKQLTFGNVTEAFLDILYSLERDVVHYEFGFEHQLSMLEDHKNWNLSKSLSTANKLTPSGFTKPRVSIYRLYTRTSFELHVIPWCGNREIKTVASSATHPELEFHNWNPVLMATLLRIKSIPKFIHLYFQYGDEMDLKLIKHAHFITEKMIDVIESKFEVIKVEGATLQGYFEYCELLHQKEQGFKLPPSTLDADYFLYNSSKEAVKPVFLR